MQGHVNILKTDNNECAKQVVIVFYEIFFRVEKSDEENKKRYQDDKKLLIQAILFFLYKCILYMLMHFNISFLRVFGVNYNMFYRRYCNVVKIGHAVILRLLVRRITTEMNFPAFIVHRLSWFNWIAT